MLCFTAAAGIMTTITFGRPYHPPKVTHSSALGCSATLCNAAKHGSSRDWGGETMPPHHSQKLFEDLSECRALFREQSLCAQAPKVLPFKLFRIIKFSGQKSLLGAPLCSTRSVSGVLHCSYANKQHADSRRAEWQRVELFIGWGRDKTYSSCI